MRVHARRKKIEEDLRLRIPRLKGLPLRPVTARSVLGGLGDETDDADSNIPDNSSKIRLVCELDPGWVLAQSTVDRPIGLLALVAETPWWTTAEKSAAALEMIGRLWRYSAAVAQAACWFARDGGDSDPFAVGRAALLSQLGCWVVAAIEPEWLVDWWHEPDPVARRRREVSDLGTDLNDLGRRLAEKWGCDPLVVDAVWLNGDHGVPLNQAACEPDRLAYIQEASRWAEKTPWSLGRNRAIEVTPNDPRMRILVAEVQVRCSSTFIADDATPYEEQVTRQNASLRLRLNDARREKERGERLVQALADSDHGESLEEWAARAALSWCAEAEVSSARVVWSSFDRTSQRRDTAAGQPLERPGEAPSAPESRPPSLVIPLEAHGRTRAEIQLWGHPRGHSAEHKLPSPAILAAWNSWAALVADRALMERRLQTVVRSYREAVETEEARLRLRKLDALSEFAGGAGHELNNPLAVIVGRTQLILARTSDSETIRSLRIILDQAGRAHRILRDLMFVARAPRPRRRSCRPSELLSSCMREHQAECTERGIRLISEVDESLPTTWADPEALRHLADILVRNAIQATPAGGKIVVRANMQEDEQIWSFSDTGKGLGVEDAAHLFDPFYCGRQAGRGLGLGLPRAARIVELAGGQLRWMSNPAHGTTFHVNLPITAAPDESDPDHAPRPLVGPPVRRPSLKS